MGGNTCAREEEGSHGKVRIAGCGGHKERMQSSVQDGVGI